MRILQENDKEKYKKFLENHERCNFTQSLEWANVKDNWNNEVVLAEDKQGNIVGSISVLIRKIPIFGNLMYAARGPICDIHNEEVLKQLTDGLKKIAKKYNSMVVKIEPDIKSDDKIFRNIVTKLGYSIKDDAKTLMKKYNQDMYLD